MLNKLTLFLGIFSVLLFMSGILLAKWQVVSANTGAALFVFGGVLGLLAMLAAVAVLFVTRSFPVAMVGLLGLLPLVAVVGSAAEAFRYPRINDVSTDLENPPGFTHATTLPANQARDLTFPAEFAPVIREAYADVAPLFLDMPPDQAYTRALRAAEDMRGWTVTYQDVEQHIFEAVALTRLFRWHDDIVVRVTPHNGGSRLDVRSKSRDGQSDLGANARRITAYLDKLRL